MTARESWTESRGWHVCGASVKPCLGSCARRGILSWRLGGHCPRCDGPMLDECCDGTAGLDGVTE